MIPHYDDSTGIVINRLDAGYLRAENAVVLFAAIFRCF